MAAHYSSHPINMILKTGTRAPSFTLPDQNGTEHSLADYAGKWIVLYFYPKDDTPGCTTEALTFEQYLPEFKKKNAVILGVSVDSTAKHKKFCDKQNLTFTLLSDEQKVVVEKYGVWAQKKFLGRSYMGILRTTFLIDPSGVIVKVYENVKPPIHAKEVLADLGNK